MYSEHLQKPGIKVACNVIIIHDTIKKNENQKTNTAHCVLSLITEPNTDYGPQSVHCKSTQ